MASELMKLGCEPWIVGRQCRFIDEAKSCGIQTTINSFGFDCSPRSIAEFLYFFSKQSIERVVVNISKEMRTAGIAARMLGIPVVHRIGAPFDFDNDWKIRLFFRLLRPNSLCCSEFVRKSISNNVPIYNSTDLISLHPGVKPMEKQPEKVHPTRTIIATSQLTPDKAHHHLLQALRQLSDEGMQFRCIIAGRGSSEQYLHKLCNDLGLDDKVEWTGFVPDVERLLNESDIFVLPTFAEPLGHSLEEAMAQGLVPVARKAGGVPEIWPASMQHLMIDPSSDELGFAEVLKKLLTISDEELLSMKRNAHKHACAAFAADRQAQQFLDWLSSDSFAKKRQKSRVAQ